MPSFSILRTKCIYTSSMNSRKRLLDIISNRRLFLDSAKYATPLPPAAAMYSFARNEWSYCPSRKKEDFHYCPLLQIESQMLRNKVLERFYSTGPKLQQVRKGEENDIIESSQANAGELTVGQKVKQAGKDASYMGVLVIGFGITGVLIWYVLSELLFSFSPNSVYSKALNVVKQHVEVSLAIGEPIKAYGEETSRGRRRHVSHQEYVVDGCNYMRVKFYISGSKRKATVHVDTKETSRGNFEFRYIFVELDGYPSETIVVEDNR